MFNKGDINMGSKNNEDLKKYHEYKRGLQKPTNQFIYIDKVKELYGKDYSDVFEMDIEELIIRFDSLFRNIKSEDVAEILKKSEIARKDKPTPMLINLFKFDKKFKPKYNDGQHFESTYADDSQYYVWDVPTNRKKDDSLK